MLKLKEGWENRAVPWDDGSVDYVIGKAGFAASDAVNGMYVHVLSPSCVVAFKDGGVDQHGEFETIEQAHEWLLSVGSESPWEESAAP